MFVNIQFFSVLLISDIEPKWHWLGDRAYHYCWRLVEQGPMLVLFSIFLMVNTRRFLKKNWITNSILFAHALWLVPFNRRMIRFRPAFFSTSTQTAFRCMVFYGTLNSKVDVNTCIEFQSRLWKNSGTRCQVSNGLAQSPAIFLAWICSRAQNPSFEAVKTMSAFKWKLMIVWKRWNQKLWFLMFVNIQFLSVHLLSDIEPKWLWLGDRAYNYCWRLVEQSPMLVF